jgi:hypothetical protein
MKSLGNLWWTTRSGTNFRFFFFCVHQLEFWRKPVVDWRVLMVSKILSITLAELILFVNIILVPGIGFHVVSCFTTGRPVVSYGSLTIVYSHLQYFAHFGPTHPTSRLSIFRTGLAFQFAPTLLARASSETSSVSRRTKRRWSRFLAVKRRPWH